MNFSEFKVGMLVLNHAGALMLVEGISTNGEVALTRCPGKGLDHAEVFDPVNCDDVDILSRYKPFNHIALANTPREVRCKNCDRRVFENDESCWHCTCRQPGRK